MLKLSLLLVLAASVLTTVRADLDDFTDLTDFDDEEVTATARFAFVNVNSDGSITFTLNATSLQYTLLAALAGLVLASILLPLLGLLGIGRDQPDYSYAYVDSTGYAQPSYQATGSNYGYKRSMGWTGHIMETLAKAYQKYEATKSDKKKDL